MAEDIAPALLEKIKADFERRLKNDKTAQAILEWMAQKSTKLDYSIAYQYSKIVGDIMSSVLLDNLGTAALPDGRLYYNIADRVVRPILGDGYNLISKCAEETQKALNKKAGIGLAAKKPQLNENRVQGLIDKVSSEAFDKTAWVLNEPVKNFAQNIIDNAVQENIEFQYRAGFTPKIRRILASGCCDWCAEIAGEYEYPDVPENFYRRHLRCHCVIIYEPERGRYQGVHSKRYYVDANAAEIGERKHKLDLTAKAEKARAEKAKAERIAKAKTLKTQRRTGNA